VALASTPVLVLQRIQAEEEVSELSRMRMSQGRTGKGAKKPDTVQGHMQPMPVRRNSNSHIRLSSY